MPQNLDITRDTIMQIDRYIKAGRIHFTLLTNQEFDRVETNEIYIDYGTDENGTPIHPMNGNMPTDGKPLRGTVRIKGPNGEKTELVGITAKKLKEFIDNFLEVSVNRTKDYEPSMWLMLREDATGDTGYNDSTIEQFYDFIKKNKSELTPYILQTFKEGKRDILIPYVTSDLVFYDVSKIIQGESIKNLDDVFTLLYKLSTEISRSINELVNSLKKKIDSTLANLNANYNRANNTLVNIEGNIRDLKQELSKYDDVFEKAVAVGKSAYSKKDITVKRGDVIIIQTQGNKSNNDTIEIPDIDVNDTNAINAWKPSNPSSKNGFNTAKLLFIYTHGKYMNIMETVTKPKDERITESELRTFITKHEMNTMYTLTNNSDILDYRFENDRTFIVNMLPTNGTTIQKGTETQDDVAIPICHIKITYVNRLNTNFPDNNSNNWKVGEQYINLFKGEKLMPWHLDIPSGYVIYRMPCNSNHQHNPLVHGYVVNSSMSMIIELTPTTLPTYVRFSGYTNTAALVDLPTENLMMATDIYDLVGLNRWSKKGYASNWSLIYQQMQYAPTLMLEGATTTNEVTADGSRSMAGLARLSISSPDIGHPWSKANESNLKFYTISLRIEVYDHTGTRLVPYKPISNLIFMVKPGFNLNRNSFNINPDGANNRYTWKETTFDTPVQNIRSFQYHTVKLKLTNASMTHDTTIINKMFLNANWYTQNEINTMDSIIFHQTDPQFTPISMQERRVSLPIRYNFREWNPIDKKWEQTFSSANKHTMIIPRHIVGGKYNLYNLNLSTFAHDFYHDMKIVNPLIDVVNPEAGEIQVIRIFHHTELFKLIRLNFRDSKDNLLYVSEFKVYVHNKNTITADDINKHKPNFLNLNLTGFTNIGITLDTPPVVNIDVKTASIKVKQSVKRETIFKFHIENNPNLVIYTQKVDTTNLGNTIKHRDLPSILLKVNKDEIYHFNGIPNYNREKNHRYFPSDTVLADTTYDLTQVVNVPIVDGIKFLSIIERINTDVWRSPDYGNTDDNYTAIAKLLIANNNDFNVVKSKLSANNLPISNVNYILMRKGIDYTGRLIYIAGNALDHYRPVLNPYNMDGTISKWYGALDKCTNNGNHTIITAVKRFNIKHLYGEHEHYYNSGMTAHNLASIVNKYLYYRWIPIEPKSYTTNATWYPHGVMYFGDNSGKELNKYINKITNNINRPSISRRPTWPSTTGNVDVYIKFNHNNDLYKHTTWRKITVARNTPIGTYFSKDRANNTMIDYEDFQNAGLIRDAINENVFISRSEYFAADHCLVLHEYTNWNTNSLKAGYNAKTQIEFSEQIETLANMWYMKYKGVTYNTLKVNINEDEIKLHNPTIRLYMAKAITDGSSILSKSSNETNVSNSSKPNSQGTIVPPVKLNQTNKPSTIQYTADKLEPEAYLSPIILTGNNDGTRVYIEFGPGINAYLPHVGTNDTLNDINRIKASDIMVAQYGNPKYSNTVSFAEVSNNGTIYIGCNYDMTFTLHASYLSRLNVKVVKNSAGINDVVAAINGKRDLNTLGLTSFRNSVINRDATISIPRGIRLNNDITMVPGLSTFKALHPNLTPAPDVALLDRDFSIPLRKLVFRSTYVKFNRTENSFSIPTSYWKPGFTFTVSPYINGGSTVRYISRIKNSPSQEEIDTGIMKIEFDRTLALSTGMTVGYTIDAPNWKTSDEVLDTIK